MSLKTLIYTCVYDNLNGTEFGGRPSRDQQYFYGLLSLINMEADLTVCFTYEGNKTKLEQFIYEENCISRDKFVVISFDLVNTKYFEDIRKLKNLDQMLTFDRCYEIQYNKLFFLEYLNLEEYQRVYWFDAGLSHIGIFPEMYAEGSSRTELNYERKKLFNNSYLKKLNSLSDDKLLLFGINNRLVFRWGQPLSQKYYNEYDDEYHIIGGLFGGTPENILDFKNKFEDLLIKLLKEETSLFFEEILFSCLYYNNKESINLIKFDYWNYFDNYPIQGKYFYELFL